MAFEIGWFSTGKDEQARILLQKTHEAVEKKEIGDVRICYVFSNREKGENKESDKFIKLVYKLGIPFLYFSSKKFKPKLRKRGMENAKEGNFELIEYWRALYDEEVMKKVERCKVEVIFLAGYMLILSKKMCEKFFILNLHPALPGGPKGSWQEVIWELIKRREREAGAMIHRVTPELDAGPALTYCKFPIRGDGFDSLWERMEEKLKSKNLFQIQKEEGEKELLFRAIREEQKKREIPLVLTTLRLLAKSKINLYNLKEPFLVEL